ncbi:hypothetical protein RHGRI_020488 [Rhododendron griersonianum]|uniref:Uncharacterized protein n=1 Tax=Rhododendron griersonianum TaxID=479676 RepID=A0AAV6JL35_9ERIC|nr:hypothetical protein RHGRI_020488 [Rhododendron griersonianum]
MLYLTTSSYRFYCSGPDKWGSVPNPRAIFPRAPEGSVPTPETYYRGLRTDPPSRHPRASYRPPKRSTEGSRASPLRLMRHSIEKNPREGLTWPCAPSNLIVGGSLGNLSPSDLLQVRRRTSGAAEEGT